MLKMRWQIFFCHMIDVAPTELWYQIHCNRLLSWYLINATLNHFGITFQFLQFNIGWWASLPIFYYDKMTETVSNKRINFILYFCKLELQICLPNLFCASFGKVWVLKMVLIDHPNWQKKVLLISITWSYWPWFMKK